MSASLLTLFKAWDSFVLQRVHRRTFRIVTEPPAWVLGFIPDARVGLDVEPGTRFLYLENFLFDAEAFWALGVQGRKDSDSWIEADSHERDMPLKAAAVFSEGASLLILRHLAGSFTEHADNMQAIRNNLLTQEHLEQEVRRRTRKIREREEELVFRLLAAAGVRDRETGAHIRRIGLYAAELARALGWRDRGVEHIRLAAPMHDLGKIGVPDRILRKPGPLTDAERQVMRGHTEVGARLLEGSDIDVLVMGAQIARCHHERWDGSGYPQGMQGEDIPEAARIVAIVDAYDAMVQARVYKPALPEDEVVRRLRAARGKHFDPRLLDAFLACLPKMRQIAATVPDESTDPRTGPVR